jgi:hypothetical protein
VGKLEVILLNLEKPKVMLFSISKIEVMLLNLKMKVMMLI